MSLRILIVEDERIIAEDVRSMLETLDYQVIDIADDGEKALEILSRETADLVLMDIKIRGEMNGIETAQRIYSRFQIPVVYLTAYADSSTIARIKETVAYGFLVKPASRETIQGTIELAVYKHDMDHKLRARDDRLDHLNQVLRAIRNVNQLITKETDRTRLIQDACVNLAETLGYQRVWIALVDEEHRPIAFGHAGFTEPFDGSADLFHRDRWVACAASALGSSGLTVIRNPEQECRSCPLNHGETGYSRFSMRLEFAGKIYGLMSVAVSPIYADDAEERGLFQELAGDVAFALYRIEIEEKQHYAEKLIEARERTLSTLMDNLPGMAYRCLNDSSRTIQFVSQGCWSLSGYLPYELIDNKIVSFVTVIHPDDREEAREAVLHPSGKNRQFEMTYRIQTASGVVRWVWERGSYTSEKQEGYEVLEGVIHDITDKVRAEEAMRASEERYRTLIENMTDSVFMIDRENQVLSVNQAAIRFIGRNTEQVIGKSIFDLFPKELAKKYAESIEHVFNAGQPLVVERKTVVQKRELWLVASLSPIMDESGRVEAVIGVTRNISEQKQAEQRLKESEARYRAIVEDQTEFIERWLPSGICTFVNQSLCREFKTQPEEWIGKNIYQTLPTKERKRLKAKIASLTPACPDATDESEMEISGGEIRWVQWTDRGIFDENGNIREIQSVGRDITERKKAEMRLEDSEKFLSSIIEQSPDPMWISDREGTLIRINPACLRLLNITEDEVVGKYNVLRDSIVEDQGAMPLVKSVFEKRKAVHFHLRYDSSQLKSLKLKKSASVFLEVSIFPIMDAQGAMTHAVIQHMDVTERELAQENLRLKMDELERFNTLMVGREERMIELKREVNALCKQLGIRKKYRTPDKV